MQAHLARVTAVAGVVLAVSACGGGSSGSSTTGQPSTFRADFARTVGHFKQTAHAIGVAIQGASSQTDAQLVSTFRGLAAAWQSDLNRLKPLTPPGAVAEQFATLTGSATRAEGDLQAVVAAAQTHNASAAKQATMRLVIDILAAKGASLEIEHRLGIS